MMPEAEIQRAIQALQTDFTSLRTDLADVKAEVRVVKHDQANVRMVLDGIGVRFDKLEERLGAKIDALTTQQHRGAGFFAGVAAVGTVCAALLGFIVHLLFGRS